MRYMKRLLIAAGLVSAPAVSAHGSQILIDFGSSGTQTTTDSQTRSWNNVTDANDVSGSPFTLRNILNTDSGYRMSISNPSGVTNPVGFNGANTNGTTSPTGSAASHGYPSSATQDSLYGNTIFFTSATVEAVRITLSSLNPTETYSFDFFASRTGVTDNRETEYRIAGSGTPTSVYLNAANNTGNIASLAGVAPDGNNQIVIDIDPGPNNTNTANGFYYLGVMEINSVPEPTALALMGIVPAIGLLRRKRSFAKTR